MKFRQYALALIDRNQILKLIQSFKMTFLFSANFTNIVVCSLFYLR